MMSRNSAAEWPSDTPVTFKLVHELHSAESLPMKNAPVINRVKPKIKNRGGERIRLIET